MTNGDNSTGKELPPLKSKPNAVKQNKFDDDWSKVLPKSHTGAKQFDEEKLGEIIGIIGFVVCAFVVIFCLSLCSSGSKGGSGSGGQSSAAKESTDSRNRITDWESYGNATEAEKRDWAESRARAYRDGGFENVSAKDLKDAMDAMSE